MMRYVDDVFGVLAWDCRCPRTKRIAMRIIDMLEQSTYPKSVQLLREPVEGWFPFLESKVLVPQCSSTCIQFNVKNFQPVVSTAMMKFHTVQHRESFMTSSDAVARITCTLYRLRDATVHPAHRLINILQVFVVYSHLAYTTHDFRRALAMIQRKTGDTVWSVAADLIQIAHSLYDGP